MTIQQIHYAITISERGSFNKAAEVLYVAQPSLTNAIRELEKELGITIFYRSGRGVTLTNDGEEFIQYARQLYQQYDQILDKYGKENGVKKKFGISAQHYSFAVKSFVEMVKKFDMDEYEFSIRETKTKEVIDDVASFKSELGIIYLSDFNRTMIEKTLQANNLEFEKLIECDAYVYLWKGHPLAKKKELGLEDLTEYPALAFEQGDAASFYFSEEIFSTQEYPRMIKATDRATMLNLMIGLNGYMLCSGIISEELNGTDYITIPFRTPDGTQAERMEIGYIKKKNMLVSKMGELFIEEMKKTLGIS